MATILELANRYGVSKSTMRRRVMDCMPEVFNGRKVNLSEEQIRVLEQRIGSPEPFMNRSGEAPVSWDESIVNDSEPIHEPPVNRFGEPEAEESASKKQDDVVARLLDEVAYLRKILDQEQRLHAMTQQRLAEVQKQLEAPRRSWFRWWFFE